jgi:hypothetical protein
MFWRDRLSVGNSSCRRCRGFWESRLQGLMPSSGAEVKQRVPIGLGFVLASTNMELFIQTNLATLSQARLQHLNQ